MSDTQDDRKLSLDRLKKAIEDICDTSVSVYTKADAIIELCRAHFQWQAEPVAEACPYCGGTEGHWEGCKAPVMLPFPAKEAQEEPLSGLTCDEVASLYSNGVNLYTSPPIPADQWQPIETINTEQAPKSGKVLVCTEDDDVHSETVQYARHHLWAAKTEPSHE